MKTNIFLNAYQQPENKLTYSFIALLEFLNSKELMDFLIDRRFVLSEKPITNVRTVYGGYERNPDGSVELRRADGVLCTIFLEVKTWRRPIDEEQLIGHIKNHLKDHDLLLFISTSRNDCEKAKKLDGRIISMPWNEIAQFLNYRVTDRVANQFVRYGRMRGEFLERPEISEREIEQMVSYFGSNITAKISRLFHDLCENSHFKQLLGPNIGIEYRNDWGREGVDFGFSRPIKQYKAWYFFGIYNNEEDHEIPFKNEGIPELAFFLDIDSSLHGKLLKDDKLVAELASLERSGFEFNHDGAITNNKWRLLFHRTPLTQVKELNERSMVEFATSVLSKLDLGKNHEIREKLFT